MYVLTCGVRGSAMVRKIIIVFLVLAAISSLTIAASAAPISAAYNDIAFNVARALISDAEMLDSYIFYSAAENTYILAIGKLKEQNNIIQSDSSVEVYTITVTENTYTVDQITDEEYQLNVDQIYLYSNLNSYPDIIERGNRYEEATLFMLVIGLCLFLIRSIFNFTLRLRR